MTIPDMYRDPRTAIIFLGTMLLVFTFGVLFMIPQPIPPNPSEVSIIITPVKTVPVITTVITPINITHKNMVVDVDSEMGFYHVRGDNKLVDKLNITLSVGDTIKFVNDDSWDFPVYIQNMSGDVIRLRYNYASVSYTFNRIGEFTFHIQSRRDNLLSVKVI